ncbi:MAG: hypothetical protein IIA83_00880 [Thaumarchaeota archaeon]|nr:hypothetical protein [Nitrososphaerota archaeon]
MNMKVIGFLIILSIIFIIPVVDAQLSIGAKAVQKSVEVIINSNGEIHVKHVIISSNLPSQVDLIEGTVSNLVVTNEQGKEKEFIIVGDKNGVMIFSSQRNSIIEYNLDHALSQKDNLWTWNFKYSETISFIFPKEVGLVFVNKNPVFLGEKNGIACHGCQMVLEYPINELKNINQVNWEDKEFLVETRTSSEIENFDFNQPAKKISFKVNDNNQFVTIIIPLELLWEPYSVFLNDDEILKREIMNNGTHVWLNIRPETSGEITIIGATVIPEFPIIAPLAIGFLMILVVPLMKKFNLR